MSSRTMMEFMGELWMAIIRESSVKVGEDGCKKHNWRWNLYANAYFYFKKQNIHQKRAASLYISTIINKNKKECRDPGLNRGPSDLQSDALPTELSRLLEDGLVVHAQLGLKTG